VESAEAEGVPEAGIAAEVRPVRRWRLPRLPQHVRKPAVWGVALAVIGGLGGLLFLVTMQYLRLARMSDHLLAEGPFSSSTDILAAPETIATGDALTPEELAGKLERAGYSGFPRAAGKSYEVQAHAVQILPGADSSRDRVRVEFARGKIAAIVSLRDRIVTRQYQLDPRLLTNISANREKRRMVRFADIPQSLRDAVTSAEDKRFFHHWGFDYRRGLKAAYVDFKDGRKQQGASTLTMQLARAFFLDPGKNWRRKVDEILITIHLEHTLTKQQIFEDYANEIYFGRRGTYSINGLGEAARVYFGKELRQIDVSEAALLAGLIQRPSYYNPFRYPERAIGRRNQILALMRRNEKLTQADYRAAVVSPLTLAPPASGESEYSYFISMMNDELQANFGESAKQSRSIVTTLDPELQKAAEAAVRSGMDAVDQQLRKRKSPAGQPLARPQVALIALDPRTGEIKALVGGRNYGDSQLNHVLSMRQPGSVFKPFVYAAAIGTAVDGSAKAFTPATLLSDEETTFSFNGETYQPKDFHNGYQGDVTLRTALAHSLNVATVSLAEQVGYQRVVSMARRAGLNDKIMATPSMALGSYETTPLEIAAAYTIFANQGTWVKPTTIAQVLSAGGAILSQHQPQTRAALDPRVAYITQNMMQEVLRSGTGAAVRSRGFVLPAAGKTGTSRDGWFAGFTTELLCVVWVGFDDNRELNLEGARSALPIWAEFMKRASKSRPYSSAHEFRSPAGVISAGICEESGNLAGSGCPKVRTEWFISGTEPTSTCGPHSVPADIGVEIEDAADPIL
jgi:penicillin-binding protein 1B